MAIIASPASEAENMAREIVEKRLAACAQVSSPVTSFYWWDGKLQQETEVLIFL
ncbi:MAG: divalent cation tolerance protein CutA, partial [Spirochaetota bacterium]